MTDVFERYTREELANRVVLLDDVPDNSFFFRKPGSPNGSKELEAISLAEGEVLGIVDGNVVGVAAPSTTSYLHDQTTPSMAWTITHNKNNVNVDIAVMNDNNERILTDTARATGPNTVVITTLAAIKGRAILTFII